MKNSKTGQIREDGMTEKPILFSAPMIRAILDGRKTQTRRVLKHGWATENRIVSLPDGPNKGLRVVPYAPGDVLWVRETWCPDPNGAEDDGTISVFYAADHAHVFNLTPGKEWKVPKNAFWGSVPSIHMPRWASRITLKVTAVKVERLQDISEDDARAEGVQSTEFWRDEHPPSICFSVLWNSIHGPDAWHANPWVAAITFERVT
jgi:hypothetical protein